MEGELLQWDFRTTALIPQASCLSSFVATEPSALDRTVTTGCEGVLSGVITPIITAARRVAGGPVRPWRWRNWPWFLLVSLD
jgi:hypothetical protein